MSLFSRALILLCWLCPGLLLGDAPDAVVTFSEIHYHPPGSQDGEWIELHNQMAVRVDLSRWSLAGGVDFQIPKGTVIEPGGFLVIAKNPADPSLAGVAGVLGPFVGNLSNSGERLDLLNPTGRLMDRVAYGEDDPWPVAADGLGATLAKFRNGSVSEQPGSWGASKVAGGTPGAVNDPTADGPVIHELVGADDLWRYLDDGVAPAGNWKLAGFNDAAWDEGGGPFGSGVEGGSLTVLNPLAVRYRAGAIVGVGNAATFATWQDTHVGDGTTQHATAGGNPTYRTNVTPSGEPVVRFDGNDEFRASAGPGIGATSGFVYFMVCRGNGPQANGGVNDGSGAYLFDRDISVSGNPLVSLKADNGRYGFQKRYDDGSGLGGPVSSTTISTTQFQIVAVRRNVTASRFEIWVDGVMEGSVGDGGGALTPQPIVVGRHATSVNNGFNGDIAELLIYQSGLSDEEFNRVGSYLEARYGLSTAFPNSQLETEFAATPTRYLRRDFSFSGDASKSALRLEHTVADGAVFYLNGVEIARQNLPGGAVGHGTAALSDVTNPVSSGVISLPADALVQGDNVLAVSLHSSESDTSGYFSATLEAVESATEPGVESDLRLHEIAGAGDPAFFIEIHNAGDEALSLGGYQIVSSGLTNNAFPMPAVSLAAGDFFSFSEAELGFRPLAGDRIGLSSPLGSVMDARVATNRLRGRGNDYPGRWMFPASPTPGGENVFSLTHDVVISEICYHPPDLPKVPGIPPTISTVPLLPYNATWRYNATGANLGVAWAATAHPVGGGWLSGGGIHAYSPNNLPVATGTLLANPNSNSPYVVTYYFESDFVLDDVQAENIKALQWSQVIDDGAVFHLNGVEIHRYNMPAGIVGASTFSSGAIGTPSIIGPVTVTLPAGLAVEGTNRLSVEVHQAAPSSSDVAFGVNVSAVIETDPGVPNVPVRPSEEEWVELHNRGDVPIDLSGWNFSSGISFEMPQGTVMEAGSRLVVAKDPALHVGMPVVGPYSGSLSRGGETLLLRDSFNNPADMVSYLDGGRWPGAADGEGSTIELRDSWADNSLPESWAASDETARHSWETHTYRGVASASSVGPDGQWRDFVLGLLSSGEVLLDDIRVTEDPDGTAIELITGGDFESGTGSWRFLGNHRDAEVIPDPADPSNQVLRLRSTGTAEHMHNHVETILANGRSIVNGRTYEISFRARWVRGINLLNTRLYFNRLARTTVLSRPLELGTPGGQNSTAVANLGPGFTDLAHHPVVPAPGEPVTIAVGVADPDGVGAVTLHYSVAGASYVSVPMAAVPGGTDFVATLPGQSAATVVRFHVSAIDSAEVPAESFFPADGASSHALYQVDDGLADGNGLHNIRIIMDPADKALLYQTTNLMSNGRIGCTVIYNEREVYHDVGVRLKSSQRGRPVATRVGFNLGFNKGQLFRGSLGTIAIDRSEGQITGCQEILYDHMIYASGGVPAEYNDLVKVIAPDPAHSSAAILQLARFSNTFLDSQFENGSDGTVYEYELIYYPTTADVNGYKLPQPDSVVGSDLIDLGDNKEDYRWILLTKNNEEADDYSRVIEMSKRFGLSGAAFEDGLEQVIDVDQWLRALAQSCASGAGDSFFDNSNHNGQFYARPSDGRVLYFPHDLDFAYNATRSIFQSSELQKLIAQPSRRRAYLGHLHHICTTVFNQGYMAAWTEHYGSMLPAQNFGAHLSYINTRSNYILNAIHSDNAPISFAITTNGGLNFSTSESPVTLSGNGWVDVREIRLAGSVSPLPVQWISSNQWQVDVPLAAGVNPIVLEAWNLDGEMVGTDSIVVTNTGMLQSPVEGTLVMSEIYYNPPGQTELTEFVELLNTTTTSILDLTGVSFTDGITFTFPANTQLMPGERILVAKDVVAFAEAFGGGLNVVGGYPDNLSNSGERITLSRADGGVILSFVYSDQPPWPVAADGDGYSLTLISPYSQPDHSDPRSWRASIGIGGSPDADDSVDYADWKSANGGHGDDDDVDGDGLTTRVEYFLGGDPNVAEVWLAPSTVLQPDGSVVMSIDRAAGSVGVAGPEASTDLEDWALPIGTEFLSTSRLPGFPARDRLVFRVPAPVPAGRIFVRFAFGP